MCLISDSTTCALCEELLGDRPFLVTPYEPSEGDPLLRRFYRVPMHYACVAAWPERERFSRPCYLAALAGCWSSEGTVVRATRDWFLHCGPTWRDLHPPFAHLFPEDIPSYAEVYIPTWPSPLYGGYRDWASYVSSGFRDSLAGAAVSDAEAAMIEVRKFAPSVEELEQLRLAIRRTPREKRTPGGFGEYLATFWPEAAAGRNWALLDEEARVVQEDLETDRRRQAEIIETSNTRARRLAIELLMGKPLECPHCERSTHEMRYIDSGANAVSYFVCGLCARSFSGSETAVADKDDSPE